MSSLWGCGLALGLVSLLITPAAAKTWHVSANQTGDAPTIQAAIDSCNSADTVLVGPGTYYENISLLGKNISVRGASGAVATILNGGLQTEPVVRCVSGEPSSCVLEGFTITGGRGHDSYGGGVYIYNSSPLIRHNIIQQNQTRFGGGLYVTGDLASPVIDNNTISENTAEWGGGLFLQTASATLTNNNFLHNTATGRGGGVYMSPLQGNPAILGNQFRGNEAVNGGGLFVNGGGKINVSFNLFANNKASGEPVYGGGGGATFYLAYLSLKNNTFVQNEGSSTSASLGGALCFVSVYYSSEFFRNILAENSDGAVVCLRDCYCPFKYLDNILWANTGGAFVGCNVPDSTWVSADPEFCDPASGDYSLSSTSPAFVPQGPIGAFPEPGCGPVPTRNTTWGGLKTRMWKN